MKRALGRIAARLALGLLVFLLLSGSWVWASPTTPEQARRVVENWLSLERQPLGASLGQQIKEVQTFADTSGNPLYYVVYLNPAGFVIVPGDDLVEPIIGFLSEGHYDPSPANPLGALVSRDVPGRLALVRKMETQARAQRLEFALPGSLEAVQRKWAWLESLSALEGLKFGLPNISDVRVAPLVQSKWNQFTDDNTYSGNLCYNYYTPENYPCGCVATAMAQLMRYHKHPTTGVGTGSFAIQVDGVDKTANLRGGNGSGGPYDWTNMVLDPKNTAANETQRRAIGALTYDAGVAANMRYSAFGSGALSSKASDALVNVFKYSNSMLGIGFFEPLPPDTLIAMVNPNLDANLPVILGVSKDTAGHEIVADGYGYNASTLYHHLNLGWSGNDDAWYNLPNIDSSPSYTAVDECIYNIYLTGTGEIISGRVTDSGGNPLSGATVTATEAIDAGTYNATTNDRGIYALTKVPSSSTFTVKVTKPGYTFTSQTVTTDSSSFDKTGNLWGINFVGSGGSVITLNQALDNNVLTFSTVGNANWFGESATWFYGGSAAQSGDIADSQTTQLKTTLTGPGTLSFYWKVDCEKDYDFLTFWVGTTRHGLLTGNVTWTPQTIPIPGGTQTLTWQYRKNSSNSVGADCGWVDKVVYTPGSSTGSSLSPIYHLLLH